MNELSIPSIRRAALAAVSAGFLAGATVLTPVPAFARGTPESFADLAEKVTDAVVNISASTTVAEQRNLQIPQLPPGSPFQEFFDDFFKGPNGGGGDNGGNGGNNANPRQQRKSSSLGSGFVIDESGIVVTNNHVIGDANDVTVIFTDGRKLKAEIV